MKKSHFQLKEQPKILKLNFDGNPNYKNKKSTSLELEIDTKFEKNDELQEAVVFLHIKINDKELNEKIPFYLEAMITGSFVWKNESDEIINNFLETNAPSILLSFMRPVISNIITYAGYPPYLIPFLDLRKN